MALENLNDIDHKQILAIVDSNNAHRSKLCAALLANYEFVEFDDGSNDTIEQIRRIKPALIIVSSEINERNSIDFIKALCDTTPIISAPILYISNSELDENATKAIEAGAKVKLSRPYSRSALIASISGQLTEDVKKKWGVLPEKQRKALNESLDTFSDIADVLIKGQALPYKNVQSNCQSLVDVVEGQNLKGVLDGVRSHDDYTYVHSVRVATLLTMLGTGMGFKNSDQLVMSSGGLLHDVGKMMIPHSVLNKPGRLTEEEFEIMKSHVPETMTYLSKTNDVPKSVLIIAEQHHEKIDGTGYPYGLQGSQLNELARMAAIVDVFTALTDKRVYKEAMPASKAMSIMTEDMTGHLDQHYVKLFRSILIDHDILQ